jgi:hypothetical protein
VRKTKDAARRDELGDLGSSESEAAFAETQKNKRLRGIDGGDGRGGHWT